MQNMQQSNKQISLFPDLESNAIVSVFKDKSDFEKAMYALPLNKNNTVTLDGILYTLQLNEEQERILTHNIANVVREIIQVHPNYSISAFLSDVKEALNQKLEDKYAIVLTHCSELSGILLNQDIFSDIYQLLSHFAAQQNYFLIELINFEINNGVTYGTNIERTELLTPQNIQDFIFNLQPLKEESDKEIQYTENQNCFILSFLLNKTLAIAEGVFQAEKLLESQFGFDFN